MKNRWTVRNRQTADPDRQPDLGHLAHEIRRRGPGREQAEQGRIEVQHQRRQRPDRHQHDLALQIIADLDLFLVLVGRLVDVIVALRLEEEVTGLARGHRDQPADQRGLDRIDEHQGIADQEAERADEMQGLVDTAVMVVAMVIPSLRSQCRHESVHRSPLCRLRDLRTEIRCKTCDNIIMTCRVNALCQSQPRGSKRTALPCPRHEGLHLISRRGSFTASRKMKPPAWKTLRPPRPPRSCGSGPARSDRAAAPDGARPVPCHARPPAIAHSATRRIRRSGSRADAPPAAAAAR